MILEDALPPWIGEEREKAYSDFTERLWKLPLDKRFNFQQMYSLGHLNRMGITVRQLKSALQTLGRYDGAIDDLFEPDLAWAIARLQHDSGLEPDGIIGSLTYQRLAAEVANRQR